MTPRLEVNIENVLAAAGKIDAAKTVVAGIVAPSPDSACSTLAGFATVQALAGVKTTVDDSLDVIEGRYQEFANLIREAVNRFRTVDGGLLYTPQATEVTLTSRVADSMAALSDMNAAI